MKILYYSPHPDLNLADPAGYAVHMQETICSMRNLGHEVSLMIAGGTERVVDDQVVAKSMLKGMIRKFFPDRLWQTLRDKRIIDSDQTSIVKLKDAVFSFRPDVIYERGYYLMQSGSLVANELGVHHIVELNAPYPEERLSMGGKSLFFKMSRRVMKRVLEHADGIVVVSSALRDFYCGQYGISKTKFHVTSNGIRPQRFQLDIPAVEVKASIRIPKECVVYGFMGSVFPYHGIDRLIDAFIQLQKHNPDVYLLVIGGGLINEYRQKHQANPNILFTGELSREKAIELMYAADIAIMANSNWYGSPIKIFEYGALGKAVIAPQVGPVQDVMKHGKDGLLIGDLTSLKEAMAELLDHPNLRTQLAKSWNEKVYTDYHWDALTNSMLNQFFPHQ